MWNASSPALSYFILDAYLDVDTMRYFYFFLLLSLYVCIVCVNLLLIVVICVNRSLHEPMYMFLCSLFVNELYGSAGLFPLILVQVLADVHIISAPLCFLQIFVVYTYGNIELCNLAVMSYDRYLAICRPLQYSRSMTLTKVLVLTVVVWLYSFIRCVVTICLNVRLTLCGNVIDSLYCQNYLIVRLACSDVKVNNVAGVLGIFLSIVIPLLAIFCSYMKILRICFSGSSQTRQKAVSTCTPHLVSLLNFSFGCCFEVLQSRFDMSGVPGVLRIFLSLYFLLIQPLLNPIMYGMQMSKIRNLCKGVIFSKAFHE